MSLQLTMANSRALRIGDISFNQEGNLQVVLRYSKTDQVGKVQSFLLTGMPILHRLYIEGGPYVSQTS